MSRLVIALVICLTTSGAMARASGQAEGRLVPLSSGQYDRMSPAIRSALELAKRACGDEDITVRNGFLRYLQGGAGEEFTAVHFDQIGCGNRAEVCTSSGCLHRVFVSRAVRSGRSGGETFSKSTCRSFPASLPSKCIAAHSTIAAADD